MRRTSRVSQRREFVSPRAGRQRPGVAALIVSSEMTTLWKILGAAGAFTGVYVVRHYFGAAASAVAAAALLLGWWLLHLYTERRLDGLYSQFEQLDAEAKARALSELDPEIRKDIEKRIASKTPRSKLRGI